MNSLCVSILSLVFVIIFNSVSKLLILIFYDCKTSKSKMNTKYFSSIEIEFSVLLVRDTAFRQICRKIINIPKRYNTNCHYITHHSEFFKNYLLPPKIRKEKIKEF